jgi:hypothetical protein
MEYHGLRDSEHFCMFCEPLAGWRRVSAPSDLAPRWTGPKKSKNSAARATPGREGILVSDNLNTHNTKGAFYEVLRRNVARALCAIGLCHTPKHGS